MQGCAPGERPSALSGLDSNGVAVQRQHARTAQAEQDDEQGKMFQIQKMDAVYSNAYITIVQAAEKQMDVNQSPLDRDWSLGLSGMSIPFTPIEPSFTVDGMSYLVDDNDIQRTLDESFSSTKWSSRGWSVKVQRSNLYEVFTLFF